MYVAGSKCMLTQVNAVVSLDADQRPQTRHPAGQAGSLGRAYDCTDILVGTQEIIDIGGREGADAIVISHAAALASQGAQQGHDATAQPACQARLFGPGS